MTKTLYLLNIDNYAPQITALTYPFIYAWAKRIGADVHIINERKWPTYPVVFEKLQIYELEKQKKSDWIIYVDSDCLIHPELPDLTQLLPRDTILQNGKDFAPNRVDIDDYFLRDGRFIGTCNWFTMASGAMLDFWTPPTETLEEIMPRLHPTIIEAEKDIKPGHLIDDYVLARNLSRFGLKYTTLPELLKEVGNEGCTYLYHHYLYTESEKVGQILAVMEQWHLNDLHKELSVTK